MPKNESPLQTLSSFLPEGTFEDVAHYLQQYKVHLTVTRERKNILGNYRNKSFDKNHRISINGNLNKYSFLITLLHELAHLLAYENFGRRIQPHGKEWKAEYTKILLRFLPKRIFPVDLEKILLKELKNPAASTCAEPALTRLLRQYDIKKEGHFLVEELPEGSCFKLKTGVVFIKGERIRTRFKCKDLATGKVYLFSPVYEIEKVNCS